MLRVTASRLDRGRSANKNQRLRGQDERPGEPPQDRVEDCGSGWHVMHCILGCQTSVSSFRYVYVPTRLPA